MKKLQIGMIVLFFVLLAVPMVLFNWEENVVSEIDNRQLTNNPFGPNATEGADLTSALESYVSDRIGLRDQMILAYTQLNDTLFHKMIHPLYEYGKDDYVFFKQKPNIQLSDYHLAFADMLAEIQDYCTQRGVPFLFVFDPEKASIYPDKLREGINYANSWVQEFEAELDKRGVRYIDNTELLRQKREEGEQVFNQMYNAGHWNDLGAFYGVNNLLSALSEDFAAIQPNEKSDFAITEKLNETLLSSQFSIHEYEPSFGRLCPLEVKTDQYDAEVVRNSQHRGFGYFVNEENKQAGAPKTLVFQGSYMNEMGFKFLQTGLGEYIYVHNYENLLNFDYYFNIFQPECVVVEAAEYTINSSYFNEQGVKDFALSPVLDTEQLPQPSQSIDVQVTDGQTLSTVTVAELPDCQWAYLVSDGKVYDLDGETGSASMEKSALNRQDMVVAAVSSDGSITTYQAVEH